jgi:hypothetical protein
MVQLLKRLLHKHMYETDTKDWLDTLPEIVFGYNTTLHSTTGLTPFQVQRGTDPSTQVVKAVRNSVGTPPNRRGRSASIQSVGGSGDDSKGKNPAAHPPSPHPSTPHPSTPHPPNPWSSGHGAKEDDGGEKGSDKGSDEPSTGGSESAILRERSRRNLLRAKAKSSIQRAAEGMIRRSQARLERSSPKVLPSLTIGDTVRLRRVQKTPPDGKRATHQWSTLTYTVHNIHPDARWTNRFLVKPVLGGRPQWVPRTMLLKIPEGTRGRRGRA